MSIITEISGLTAATTNLLAAVNVSKATLDSVKNDAVTVVGAQRDQAITAKTQAETARDLAQGYASLAQATNPDSPIHTNPRNISADFTVLSSYNGWCAGPITISPSVTLTIADNATLVII